ncbi:NAD-dependent epimerase/dehydratase family protein [Litorivicinus lipolyticus]|uniref:NAD-dependent epimerase/dehydratase family protein n=1 Tax=Litorivicinus lipolyticus TaxID=418701 RepID=A0A5Q2Q7U3_9GAMM|nr:SDR family oxidoreductase [Litorivicinus lipolyticus]QGG80629.1 NAD-dependent epimerase/dehydratase family protein [Litorivicinus lipolyticus]
MNVLITGANGFVGRYLCNDLSEHFKLRCSVRNSVAVGDGMFAVGDIDGSTDWSGALAEVDAVVHTAARTHIMDELSSDPLAKYRRVNVDGTLNLARQAAEAGVKRFIFISSIKVNGEQTPLGQPFTAEDTPAPEDAYGISKWEAEQGLHQLACETGMEVVIIRPPLVYGPGVKGNFSSMIKLVAKGLPLPLGAINNQRSLVAIDNLVDLIITCISHSAAANQVFLAGDGQDLSTTELLRGVARAMGKPSRLIPVPASLLMLAATLLGKKSVAQRLLGSLQVDISKARHLLGWEPPITVEEGLRRCFEYQDK